MQWAVSNSAEQRGWRGPAGGGSGAGIHRALVNTGYILALGLMSGAKSFLSLGSRVLRFWGFVHHFFAFFGSLSFCVSYLCPFPKNRGGREFSGLTAWVAQKVWLWTRTRTARVRFSPRMQRGG